MVTWLMSDDFVKIHLMTTLVDMAHKFGIFIEHQNSLFDCSDTCIFSDLSVWPSVHKIALSAVDFVHYSRRWMVGFIMLLWSWKNAVDGVLRLVTEEYLHCQKQFSFCTRNQAVFH